MTTLERRDTVASPRTALLPRAFTAWEFIRGALFAWLWSLPCLVLAAAVGSVFDSLTQGFFDPALLIITAVAAAPIGFAATVAGAPAAFLLGRVLRRQRRDLLHVAAFALYGGAWGIVVMHTLFSAEGWGWGVLTSEAAPCAAAVALGWWSTSALALRADHRRSASR